MTKKYERQLEVADMTMLRFPRKDKIRNEHIRGILNYTVDTFGQRVIESKLR